MAQVLVYDGAGVDAAAVARALACVRRIAGGAYDVQTITHKSLQHAPWDTVTRLLVLPGGHPTRYAAGLAGAAPRLHAYIEGGGTILGIGAGAACLCAACRYAEGTPAQAVDGYSPLRLYPGVYWGPVAAAEGRVAVRTDGDVHAQHDPHAGTFLRADAFETLGVAVLATYADEHYRQPPVELGEGHAAVVVVEAGRGHAVLSGTDAVLDEQLPFLGRWLATYAHIAPLERTPSIRDPPRLTPLYVATNDDAALDALRTAFPATYPDMARWLPEVAAVVTQHAALEVRAMVEDSHDRYIVLGLRDTSAGVLPALAAVQEAYLATPYTSTVDHVPKLVVLCGRASGLVRAECAPLAEALVPYFVLPRYFAALASVRTALSSKLLPWPSVAPAVRVGDVVGYGQVVTSTQTLLEKNAALLQSLAPGTTLVATHQVAGRGRGKNAWASPRGCLQFSTRLTLPASAGAKSVFVQYLAALAIVYGLTEGLGSVSETLRGRVRIKWPNDVYAQVPTATPTSVRREACEYVKIGGILVNAVYARDHFDVVVGCGINCTNALPTTCLAAVLGAFGGGGGIALETCAAAILATFERLFAAFTAAAYDFAPFARAYRDVWMHDDQEITLQDGQRVRIVGITPQHGLLRTVPLDSPVHAGDAAAWAVAAVPGSLALQPDGNSFDMLHNLVHRKA